MDRTPISGTTSLTRLEENLGGAAVNKTPLEGERYSEALETLTGL